MNFKSLLGLLFLSFCLSANAQTEQITVEKIQKSLITKRTATWCPLCGASNVWPMVKSLDASLNRKALVIAGHHSSSSDLYSPAAKDLINNFEATFGQPKFFFDREYIGDGGSTTMTELENKANSAFGTTPVAQAGMIVTYDNNQRLLDVNGRAEFFQNTTGNYYLAYYLVRKSVINQQASQGENTEHVNVLWDAITDSSFGDLITDQGGNSGSSFPLRKQFTLPEELDINNLFVAAILWKLNEDGYYEVINVETSSSIQFGVVSRTYELSEIESFVIQPTVTTQGSFAVLELKSGIKQTDISIYNWYGQKIKSVFSGDLGKGHHQIPLEIETPGVYIVSIRSGNQISSQRLIKVNE